MAEIKTLSRRIVYENRWMRVREDVIERQDGAFPVAEVLAMITEGEIKDSATVAALGLLRLKGLF